MSSIFITYLTLIRVIKCARVICCWQESWKHSLPRVIIAWKSIAKKNTMFYSRIRVLLLNFKTIEFCCLISKVPKESRGGGKGALFHLLSVWKPLTYSAVARNVVNTCTVFRDQAQTVKLQSGSVD